MDYKIIFSDVDGTLLNSEHRMQEGTLKAIKSLKKKNIAFVIVTARGPSGIYPIFKRYNIVCPMVCYSGALIIDEDGQIVYSKGICKNSAIRIIDYIESENIDCTWNVYSMNSWIVNDKKDSRVIEEENIVEAEASEGKVEELPNGTDIGKILCMCNNNEIDEIEKKLKAKFPSLSIVKSSDTLLEIMERGVNKGEGIKVLCEKWKIDIEKTIAFGDNFNDVDMLDTVGLPFLMGNAPKELIERYNNITDNNDEEGIYKALSKIELI